MRDKSIGVKFLGGVIAQSGTISFDQFDISK